VSFDGEFEGRLARIARAVSITSPRTLTFAGQEFETDGLRNQLQALLYQHCYCRAFDGRLGEATAPGMPSDGFVAALSEANAGRARWSSGWTIASLNLDGTATVRRGTLTFRVWPGEYWTQDAPGMPPRIGALVSIYVAKESQTLQPGFYFAFGESIDDGRDTSSIVRFYWAITQDAAASLTRALTERLGRFQIPFRFKCSAAPWQYWRLDAAILYVDKRFFDVCSGVLGHVYDAVAASLRPQTPLFAKQLAPGLGFAENPGPEESFGMQRCGLVADAILEAFARGEPAEANVVQSIREQFTRNGLSFDRPYLNAGSRDTYRFSN